jgi:hypothetical protein
LLHEGHFDSRELVNLFLRSCFFESEKGKREAEKRRMLTAMCSRGFAQIANAIRQPRLGPAVTFLH